MAMKWVAQMPQPTIAPAPMSQVGRTRPSVARARWNRLMAVSSRDKADQPGHDDEPPVVLSGEAIEDTKHARSSQSKWIG